MTDVETRTGMDETLVWRLFRTDASTTAALIMAVQDDLPDDAFFLVDELGLADHHEALKVAGILCQYSPFDLAWLVAGPRQRARAHDHRERGYRVLGKPG
jgi:hypothetical protein